MARTLIFALQTGDEFGRRLDVLDGADALAAAPDVLPGFLGIAAEIHLARVALGQVVGVEAGGADRTLEVVAVYAGEEVAIDDGVARAVDDHLLVFLGRAR